MNTHFLHLNLASIDYCFGNRNNEITHGTAASAYVHMYSQSQVMQGGYMNLPAML